MIKKMENPVFQKDVEKGVELQKDVEKGVELLETKKQGLTTNGATPITKPPPQPSASTSCKPEICQAARSRYSPPELAGSPWHIKKTIFLLTFLILMVIWVIVFTTLSQLGKL
ncbi:hypothetical protein QE152_g10866 [Popillia japonica]|uniref:Uncharacterized protein n=1 Tax=Popillia japonica TaxID=7064 RepID=A0AAW1LV28_POPJA